MQISARRRSGRLLAALAVTSGVSGLVSSPTLAAQRAPSPPRLVARFAAGRPPFPLYRAVAASLGGRVYVFGGLNGAGSTLETVERYDPAAGNGAVAGSLALATHGAAAALLGGRLLVFGGASNTVHETVQSFNPVTGRTSAIAQLPGPRADTTAATSEGTTALVGGFNGIGPQQAVWATTNGASFRVLASLPQPVRYPAVATVGRTVYVFGGLVSGGEYSGLFTNDIQELSLAGGPARVVAHLPSPVAHAMAATIAGHVYLLGGSTPAGPTSQILAFIPARAAITSAGSLPQPLTDGAIAVAGGAAYLLGGITPAGASARVVVVRPT